MGITLEMSARDVVARKVKRPQMQRCRDGVTARLVTAAIGIENAYINTKIAATPMLSMLLTMVNIIAKLTKKACRNFLI